MLRRTIALMLLASMALGLQAGAVEPEGAAETVKDFYRRYLSYSYSKNWTAPRPTIPFSKDFADEIAKTDHMCKELGEDGPCGWGSDIDVYFDSQESDPNLTYANSGMTIAEVGPGIVLASFNVLPSEKNAGSYYERRVTYKLILEGGVWVVDDVMNTAGLSARKEMAEEQEFLLAHPREGNVAPNDGS